MKKAHEYSKICDADVCLGIRIRETGRVFTFSADASGFWAFLKSQLVCFPTCRVQPKKLTSLGFILSDPDSENGHGSRSS